MKEKLLLIYECVSQFFMKLSAHFESPSSFHTKAIGKKKKMIAIANLFATN